MDYGTGRREMEAVERGRVVGDKDAWILKEGWTVWAGNEGDMV